MIDQSRYEHIELDARDDGVLVARLNRPKCLNAINERLHNEISWLPVDVDLDDNVNALVITGNGRAFTAGGDLREPMDTRPGAATFKVGRHVVDHILACEKPIIAAVNGAARGLGVTLALLCDVVYAHRDASFADTHSLIGAGAGDGAQLIWPSLAGPNWAKYYLMTGETISAAEAERLGLVNFLVDGDVESAAVEFAQRLSQGNQRAIRASKVAINAQLRSSAAWVVPYGLVAGQVSPDHAHQFPSPGRTTERLPAAENSR
ncbi:MAG: enoyl-CoA hydratase-related protein [Actinomycetota bacterium]|nr:enoyl-CoA hydratase-related protein [Actinomycetota bacterium]